MKTKLYSYDTKTQHVFSGSCIDDIQYLGKQSLEYMRENFHFNSVAEHRLYVWDEAMVECAVLPAEVAGWFGSLFLSATVAPSGVCIDFNDQQMSCALVVNEGGLNPTRYCPFKYAENFIKKQPLICLTGDILRRPRDIGEFARKFMGQKFFLPEIGDAVYSFGALIHRITRSQQVVKPTRLYFQKPNKDELQFDNQRFSDSIATDAAGKMAHVVGSGRPAFNEICTAVGSHFYGKAIIKPNEKETDGVYFVHRMWATELFNEPLSLLDYAANYAPVELTTTAAFQEHVQNKSSHVLVRIVSINDEENLLAFTRFYSLFSKKKAFLVKEPSKINWSDKVPLFRYNKGYMVPSSFILDRVKNES